MNNTKILEMLEKGKIEELKAKIKEEIYNDSLKGKSGAKDRYKAMQRFVKHNNAIKEAIKHPKEIDGNFYFTDGRCLVKTSESIGEIETWNKKYGDFLKVEPVFEDMNNKHKYPYHVKISIEDIIAKAKAEGYRFTSKVLHDLNSTDRPILCKVNNTYFNLALMDYAYSIVADGKCAEAIYSDNQYNGIFLETSVGCAMVLPVRYEGNKHKNEIVIDVTPDATGAVA